MSRSTRGKGTTELYDFGALDKLKTRKPRTKKTAPEPPPPPPVPRYTARKTMGPKPQEFDLTLPAIPRPRQTAKKSAPKPKAKRPSKYNHRNCGEKQVAVKSHARRLPNCSKES